MTLPLHPPAPVQPGAIEVVCGSMFSGKTEELIRRIKRAQIARQRVQVFKPRIDNRYAAEQVASHRRPPSPGHRRWPTRPRSGPPLDPQATVVAIDEVQFFDWKVVDLCRELADRGVRVIVAGLDVDFRAEPFGPMPMLMAEAEQVSKLQAICVVCGNAASRTQRLIDGAPASYNDPVIMVGASEVYEARCRHCHQVPGRPTE